MSGVASGRTTLLLGVIVRPLQIPSMCCCMYGLAFVDADPIGRDIQGVTIFHPGKKPRGALIR